MPGLGKFFIIIGLVFVVLGVIFAANIQLPWLGKLPGDIVIKRENFSFYLPLGTCLVISVLLSLIFYLLRR
ncbi:MAG: DUF2905 domain-containing protein [Candidatus Omnitrophota bacterium]